MPKIRTFSCNMFNFNAYNHSIFDLYHHSGSAFTRIHSLVSIWVTGARLLRQGGERGPLKEQWKCHSQSRIYKWGSLATNGAGERCCCLPNGEQNLKLIKGRHHGHQCAKTGAPRIKNHLVFVTVFCMLQRDPISASYEWHLNSISCIPWGDFSLALT